MSKDDCPPNNGSVGHFAPLPGLARQGRQCRQQLRRSETGAFCQNCLIFKKELSSATHVAEATDGGWKPPRLIAGPAAFAIP